MDCGRRTGRVVASKPGGSRTDPPAQPFSCDFSRELPPEGTAMRFLPAVTLLAACSNSLPPPGMCEVGGATGEATVEHVALAGGGGYDDLTYSRALGKVIAA